MRLGKALDNETRVACRKLHRVEWGKTLTLEQYLEREDRLASHPWSQKALTSWVLTGSDGELLSQLETYRMEATCPGHDRTTAFGIASVFTEEKHRGKGYASKLVGLLLEQLRQESGDAVAVVLYSDVGPGLYAKAGGFIAPLDRPHSYFFRRWQPADSVARCQLAGPVPPPSSSGEPGAGVGAGAGGGASDGEQSGCLEEWLAATGVVLLTRAEALEAADQLAEEARHACKQTGGVAVIPTSGQVDWLLHREATYCHLLGRQPLPFHGARHERCVAVCLRCLVLLAPAGIRLTKCWASRGYRLGRSLDIMQHARVITMQYRTGGVGDRGGVKGRNSMWPLCSDDA
eukprot:jgi/Mesvir1/23927/Mv10702-RA.2